METNIFNSPVVVAMWDLFFNIHSNENEDYFLEEFMVLTSMINHFQRKESLMADHVAEYDGDRRDVKKWLNKVQDAVYRTEDFVDKILNDRLDATSPTKKSTLHKIRFRPMWVRNLPFRPKLTRKVKKWIRREAKKIVDEFKSLEMQGRTFSAPCNEIFYNELFFRRKDLCIASIKRICRMT